MNKSMDASFMESCWWVFKQLFEKQQVYRAYQIMPFSTALCTPLSQMEAKQNEKMTQDPAILVAFPVIECGSAAFEGTSLVIYTTTPWTLPANLFIAAHPDFEYLEIFDVEANKKYLLQEHGISMLYKDPKKAKFKVTRKVLGKDMVGWKYEALFPYFSSTFPDCFQVIAANYVEAGEGTGLVHQAPAFGQEDYDAAKTAGFISSKRLPPCPVTEKGEFAAEVPDYAGLHVKLADKAIIKDLRSSGRLLVESQVNHVDKFCWRSDTQLIRRAVSSWFIRVTDSIPEILNTVDSTTWVPSFVKDKRFGNWIAGAHDWCVFPRPEAIPQLCPTSRSVDAHASTNETFILLSLKSQERVEEPILGHTFATVGERRLRGGRVRRQYRRAEGAKWIYGALARYS